LCDESDICRQPLSVCSLHASLSFEAWFCAANFRIYNNRGPSSKSGPPNSRIVFDFSPHTYPSFEAAFSGKNLDFVRGSASDFIPLWSNEERICPTNSPMTPAVLVR
jgi:hypothetical protein